MRTVVLVAPYFPPLARVGALRPLKIARHLGAHGWRAVVLALPPGGGAIDWSLADAVPPDVVVDRSYAGGPLWWIESRSRTTDMTPGGRHGGAAAGPRPPWKRLADRARESVDDCTPVDGRLPHVPRAVARAVLLAREHRAEAIMACGDPWSGLVAGSAAARIAGLPFVADLRDPWTLEPERFRAKPWAVKALERRVEAAVVRSASRVVLNTRAARDAYRKAYPDLASARFAFVRNSFDMGLFEGGEAGAGRQGEEAGAGDPFRIVYFGRFRRFRTSGVAAGMMAALRRVAPDVARRAVLEVVGGAEGEDRDVLAGAGAAGIRIVPAVPYRESMAVLRGAGVLLTTLAGGAGLQVPAKLYDYLASGRPIVACADGEEIAGILEETGAGACVGAGDAEGAARIVAQIARGERRFDPLPEAVARFGAPEMAREIAGILTAVSQRPA